jgi:transposase
MNHGFMVMTLRQSSSHLSESRQIHRGQRKRIKFAAMSSPCWSFFFTSKALIVHKEFLPPGQTVNGKFYCEVLKRLRESIRRKRPDKWKNNNWFLHHDNAPAHTSLVRQFLVSKNVTVIPHPPYSPDLAPCDFFLFPKMKLRLKGRRFDTIEEIQAESQEVVNTHLRTSRDAWNHEKKKLGSLYTCPRGLLRRRWWNIGVRVINFFLWSNSPNFWVAPRIVSWGKQWSGREDCFPGRRRPPW